MGRAVLRPTGKALPPPPSFFWTLRQIATWHQLSGDAVRAAVKRGELRAFTFGKEYRVRDEDYREWLDGSRRVSFLQREGSEG